MLCCWISEIRPVPPRDLYEAWDLDGRLDEVESTRRNPLPSPHRGPSIEIAAATPGNTTTATAAASRPGTSSLSDGQGRAAAEGVIQAVTPSWKRMLVFSKVSESEVNQLEKTPEDEVDFIAHPFECPICFRFADRILRTHCCRHNLCHSCAGRMRESFAEPACPHCRQSPLILVDPKPQDLVRSYRNSKHLNERVEKFNQGIRDQSSQLQSVFDEDPPGEQKDCSTARRLWTEGGVTQV